MRQASTPVTSRQDSPHPRLLETVAKHAAHPWRKPVADHSRRAFDALLPDLAAEGWPGRPLVLDTGCGTGMSTGVLAGRFPEALVLGVDKSEARLDRRPGALPSNARLLRLDLEDFWLLAREFGVRFDRQCFFYPNPWPKPEQRLRRWPFHPVLPVALAGGGVWELRTNWKVYAEEFSLALGWLTGQAPRVEAWAPVVPETLFEKKYGESGHALWRWESGPVVLRTSGVSEPGAPTGS